MAVLTGNSVRSQWRLNVCVVIFAMTLLLASALMTGPTSLAGPDNTHPPPEPGVDYPVSPLTSIPEVVHPLPPFTPRPSNWRPSFPYPYNKVSGDVTEADITSEREPCQWYNSQYDEIVRQIDVFQFNRIIPNGPGIINGSGSDFDYSIGNLQQQYEVLATNIDQSVAFLAPRVQAFTVDHDEGGDGNYPLDGAKSFYLLWQHLSNVSAGIKSHQPDWFTGPSVQRVKRNGSVINRSHICRY
jgi:hypothetical protein